MSLYTQIKGLYNMGNDLGAEHSPAIKHIQREIVRCRMEKVRQYSLIFRSAVQGEKSVEETLKEVTEEKDGVK